LDGPLPKWCPAVALSHQDGHHSAVALLLKAALIQVSDYRLLGASGYETLIVLLIVNSGKSLVGDRGKTTKLRKSLVGDRGKTTKLRKSLVGDRGKTTKLRKSLVGDREKTTKLRKSLVGDREKTTKLRKSLVGDRG
jgi:hypothetical protein